MREEQSRHLFSIDFVKSSDAATDAGLSNHSEFGLAAGAECGF